MFVNQGVKVADTGVSVVSFSDLEGVDVSELVDTGYIESEVGVFTCIDSVARGMEIVACVVGGKEGVGVEVEIDRLNTQK